MIDPLHAWHAGAFWDAHHGKATDPGFWMAHPLCRQAINRRVTGSAEDWPLNRFARVHAKRPFSRGLSWGCGLGHFEREARRLRIVEEIDAFDLSPRSLEEARRATAEAGVTGIRFLPGNFDDPRLGRGLYDIAFFHASLHHVASLERLFRRLAFALKPRATVYVDNEFVGPSRKEWTQRHLAAAQEVLDRIPDAAKLRTKLVPPVEETDPSEAIRSSEIPAFVREFFDVVEWKPFGGQVVDLVFPAVTADWTNSPEGNRCVAEMLALEDEQLAADAGSSHHLFAVGRRKPLARLAMPLARQVVKAVKRRIPRRLRNGRLRRPGSPG